MPILNVGDKANFDRGGMFAELKDKGEKLYFRILGNPYYDGKHFIPVEGQDRKWSVTNCPRIMNELECSYCKKSQELFKLAKEEKDKKQKKLLEDEMRQNKAKITFYYPILDRTETYDKDNPKDGVARIFKTGVSVRIKIDQEKENDIDVFEYDFIVTRAEEPGAGYYPLTRLDSKQIKPFSEIEKKEIAKARLWKLDEIVEGKESHQLNK